MDHFKTHIQKTYPGMDHFLTYADNYAVGYFRKQGFSKEITLDRAIWAGYIKDYEGGTIMQCTMVRKFDYLDKAGIIGMQREAIVEKIREMSKSHIIHEGLAQFRDGAGEGVEIDPKNVPGLSMDICLCTVRIVGLTGIIAEESGWTPEMATRFVDSSAKLSIASITYYEIAVRSRYHGEAQNTTSCNGFSQTFKVTPSHGRSSNPSMTVWWKIITT